MRLIALLAMALGLAVMTSTASANHPMTSPVEDRYQPTPCITLQHFEQFGDALQAAMVLSFIGDGIPMIYSGQEAGNPQRLQFFEKDPIAWRKHPNGALYADLTALKKKTNALWNGEWGAMMVHVPNDKFAQVLSFVRQDANGKVFAVFNLSPTAQKVRFEQTLYHGVYTEHFSRKSATLDASTALELKPWEYRVFVR